MLRNVFPRFISHDADVYTYKITKYGLNFNIWCYKLMYKTTAEYFSLRRTIVCVRLYCCP